MKKLILSLFFIFLFATSGECAVKYARNVTANWNVDSTWSTTGSGGAADSTVPTNADDVIFDASFTGSITLTASTTINSLVCATNAAGTLTHNAVTLTIDSQDGAGDSLKFVSTMTYTPASSSRIAFTGTGTSKITTGGKVVNSFQFNNAGGTFQLQDNLTVSATGTSLTALLLSAGTFDPNGKVITFTGASPVISCSPFYGFVKTGTANKTDVLTITQNIIITNNFQVNGNSAINRVLVTSLTLGSAKTLTLTGATISGCSNVDFRDITFTSTGSMDFSAITGGSGDCGGNTVAGGGTLTFTTADDWFWNGSGTRNFSDYTYWYTATNGGGTQMPSTRPPLPQDTCYFDANSIDATTQIEQDIPRLPGIDFTGCSAMTYDTNNLPQTIYGSFIVVSNVTIAQTDYATIVFEGRGSHLFNGAGKTYNGVDLQSIGGSYTLTGNYITSNSTTILNGTLDASIYDLTSYSFNSSNTNVRKILMGSGTWTCTSSYGDPQTLWIFTTTTNLNIADGFAQTSTIYFSATSNVKNFSGGNLVYNNLTFNNSTGFSTIIGSNTFNTFTINAPKTVKFTAGTTQTVSSFVATGTAVNGITLQSTVTDSVAYLSDTAGTNQVYYNTINDIVAQGGATWSATTCDNNTVDAESTGWTTTCGTRRIIFIE